jgi:hypothetical protein
MEVVSPLKQPRFLAGYVPWAAHPSCAAGLAVGGFLTLMVRPSGR